MLETKSVGDNFSMWMTIICFATRFKGVLVPEEEGSKVRPTFWVGKKYLWCAKGSVCEIHGKEKTSWTYLNDHLFKDNSPLEKRS